MKIKRILSTALTLILLLPGALPALAQENAAEVQVQTVEQKKPDCKDEEPANPKDTGESKTAESAPEPTDAPDEDETLPETTDIPLETEASAEPTEMPVDAENTPEPEAAADEKGLRIANKQKADWRGVIPSDETGLPIPRLYQDDYRQTVCYWNGKAKSVASSGCGAASVSMVIAYLTGNIEQNPYTLFRKAVKSGQYYGHGLGHHTLSMLAAEYGVNSEWIVGSEAAIRKALEAGKPIIAHMGPGNFTAEGHYIVLRGLTQNGLILVNDPNSRSNSHKAFPLKTILRQARTSASFMVCWI